MGAWPRRAVFAGVIAWIVCTGAGDSAQADEMQAAPDVARKGSSQEPDAGRELVQPATDATAIRAAPTPRRPGPIARSIDRAVDELIRRHFSSCGRAEGDEVPCFPISVERKWQYSVADSLDHLEFDDSPSPGRPPTVSEMSEARPGALSASGSVGFDPVCKGRQLLKAITGRSRTYYLYRVWDKSGEHAVLRDRPIDAGDFSGAPTFHYVALGSFDDECEAIAAWRHALRETRASQDSSGEAEASETRGETDIEEPGPVADPGPPSSP